MTILKQNLTVCGYVFLSPTACTKVQNFIRRLEVLGNIYKCSCRLLCKSQKKISPPPTQLAQPLTFFGKNSALLSCLFVCLPSFLCSFVQNSKSQRGEETLFYYCPTSKENKLNNQKKVFKSLDIKKIKVNK